MHYSMKKGQKDPSNQGQSAWSRFKQLGALACTLATAQPAISCSKAGHEEAQERIRCYDYGAKTLRVYDETVRNGAAAGKELGVPFSQLAIPGAGSEPLAYACTNDGHLFWVTKDDVYIRRISFERGNASVSKVLDARHTEPDEYSVPGVSVVSAAVWKNPEAPYERITVATLTNTGLFQAARYSLEAIANNESDRGVLDLGGIEPDRRWPTNAKSGVVSVMGAEEFAVIPLGEMGKGSVRHYYHAKFKGKPGAPFGFRSITVEILWPKGIDSNLRNISAVLKAPWYDGKKGGWIVDLGGEDTDGRAIELFPTLTMK